MSGQDLNRLWANPDKAKHPCIWHIRELVRDHDNTRVGCELRVLFLVLVLVPRLGVQALYFSFVLLAALSLSTET